MDSQCGGKVDLAFAAPQPDGRIGGNVYGVPYPQSFDGWNSVNGPVNAAGESAAVCARAELTTGIVCE